MSKAVRDVLNERNRQVHEEGWTVDHDDQHYAGDLCRAGAAYALNAGCEMSPSNMSPMGEPPEFWPWYDIDDVSGGRGETPVLKTIPAWWKPKDPRRDLVRAAALIIAEIERIDRGAT